MIIRKILDSRFAQGVADLYLAPGRAWHAALAEQRELRALAKEYPDGGRCHDCGTYTPDKITKCQECMEAHIL